MTKHRENAELNSFEQAVLLLSNDVRVRPRQKGLIVLTSKESYVWACAMVLILQGKPGLSEDELTRALDEGIVCARKDLLKLLQPHDPFEPPFEEEVFRSII